MTSRFGIVSDSAIMSGECTDVYFVHTDEVLRAEGCNPDVTMEITAASLPDEWGVVCGTADVLSLLEGMPLNVSAMPEGTIFYPGEPVLRISGKYLDFCTYETVILGFLCHASGVASASAHLTVIAKDKPLYSFGSRRQHPAIAGMIERAAWIGGVAGVSNTCAPAGIPLAGTMPHALIMSVGSAEAGWAAFDRYAPQHIPRIYLCDTFCDEKFEALAAARAGAEAVRLDTPRSRRGDMRSILEEVRWELDLHGFTSVKIFLSGGLTKSDIVAYGDIVDAFGVGGAIANAPVIDFSMDIVERNGKSVSKRGKKGGVKQVCLTEEGKRILLPESSERPSGGRPLIVAALENGNRVSSDTSTDTYAETSSDPVSEARLRLQHFLRSLAETNK
ncbi:nicotinate phosphoribosyltransferase [Methanogenium sp. MK-MG]|uniref:nicotinate phosphoribosyltransferase n=1 Tax=Methanogenium sp. MK-MG TaxID=2599926 RepID=UPI0013ED43D2|nr:nicotinate phosphoribosyltransferase [Methanogenium sp. MK-MG]KAF1074674.1 putative nicotinate phosphoribosyltransferase [Methanogenium sp. MK-MG]